MKPLILFIFLGFQFSVGYGQTTVSQDTLWQVKFFQDPDAALPLLMEVAIKKSALLKALEFDKSIATEDIQLARKSILRSVMLATDYSYGNLSLIALNPNNEVSVKSPGFNRYNAGLHLSLPLESVVSRKNLIQKEQHVYSQAEYLRKNREDEIRLQVIQLYQEVVLSRNLLKISQNARQTAGITNQIAEKQFAKGEIPVTEFSRLNEIYSKLSIEHATIKNRYELAFRQLQEITGTSLSDLMAKK